MIRFEDLIEKVRATSPDADVELLRRAYMFSAYEHKGQVRHSGEPYLVHPLEVADLLADMKLDVVAVAAGLLHDIGEDTQTPIERIKERFGADIAHLAARDAQVPIIHIDGRIKRLFSIHQKLKKQKIDLDQVYDFMALRIVTNSIKDCYAALGIIHQTWSPVPGRIKDFIAMPRPNGYQSLHTAVVSERGFPFY